MTNFSDQLFTDLMREHAATLQRTELPGPSAGHLSIKRGAWLAGGAGTLAVGVTASLAAFGGGAAQAFAVTPHPDGTVTVSLSDLSGVSGANARLQDLGDRVVVVPVRAGCPSMASLPHPRDATGKVSANVTASKENGTITVDAHGIPAGDLMVLAVQQRSNSISIGAALTAPPAPACVSMPTGVPAGSGTGSRQGGQSSGGSTVHVGPSGGRYRGHSTGGPGTTGQVPTGPIVTAGPAKDPGSSINGG